MTRPGLSRRRLIGACAAGLGIAGAAGSTWPARAAEAVADPLAAGPSSKPSGGTARRHRRIPRAARTPRRPGHAADRSSVPGTGRRRGHRVRQLAAPGRGGSLRAGPPAGADAELRRVWRDNTNSPLATWDEPVYETSSGTAAPPTGGCPPAPHPAAARRPAHRLDQATTRARSTFAAQPARRVRRVPGRTRGAQQGPQGTDLLRRQPRAAPGCGAAATQRRGLHPDSSSGSGCLLIASTSLAGDLAARSALVHYPGIVIPAAGPGSGRSTPETSFPGHRSGPPGSWRHQLRRPPRLRHRRRALPRPGQRPDDVVPDPASTWTRRTGQSYSGANLQGGVSDLNALRQEQSARFTPQAVPPSLLCRSDH